MESFKSSGIAKSSYNLRAESCQQIRHPLLPLHNPCPNLTCPCQGAASPEGPAGTQGTKGHCPSILRLGHMQTSLPCRQRQIFPKTQKHNVIIAFSLATQLPRVPLNVRAAPASVSHHFGSLRTNSKCLHSPKPLLFKPRDTHHGPSARPK